jgi:signal transduction histidine kinase
MLPIILRKAAGAIGASSASVFLVDRETRDVIASAFHPPASASAPARAVADPWTGETLHRGEIRIVEDTSTLPPTQVLAGLGPPGRPTRSQISLPLHSQEGPIGVLHVGTDQTRAFSPSEVRLLTAIAEIAGNALHRARVLETLETRVSERTRELAKANERLQELDRLKSDFLSNVSHELRTPITNILLYLELLNQPGKEVDRPRYIEILRREADRLARLIEDLLTLSRIEQGFAQVTLQPVQVDGLLREVLAAHEARARSREIGLHQEGGLALPLVSLDREQMVQVFANLISNAIAYTPPGERVEVRTMAQEQDGRSYVGVVVRNSGAVIPAEDLPHVFERFYRGRNGRESGSPGTGLGLAICKEIVERHQGWIDLRSDEETGTSFIVWVPTVPRAEPAGEPAG